MAQNFAKVGQRNNTMHAIATLLAKQSLPFNAIKDLCAHINLQKFQPPLSDQEVSKIVNSVMNRN